MIEDWVINDLLFFTIIVVLIDATYGIYLKWRITKHAKVLICDQDLTLCKELFGSEEYELEKSS